ncbi:MAG TPA: hypothetical protein VKV21_01070 [Solirubrobacteraceae bacterium]|nr:hypothetical protein [Solirubrobacteraceae bacterium]
MSPSGIVSQSARRAAGALDRRHVLGTSADDDARAAGIALARQGGRRHLPATGAAELTESLRRALH